MGRDLNLLKIFSKVHPVWHTPYWAVILSGLLIGGMAWSLPIEDVAAAADWYVGLGWIVAGMLLCWGYFSEIERMEKPREIMLEEVLVSKDYSVLVPVATQEQARILGPIGSILARERDGEVLALHVVRVPPQLELGEGRIFL